MNYEYALIACRSITYAQRSVRVLDKNRIKATVRRLPANMPSTGCGHAVRVKFGDLEKSMKLLQEAKFPVKMYFCEDGERNVVECQEGLGEAETEVSANVDLPR